MILFNIYEPARSGRLISLKTSHMKNGLITVVFFIFACSQHSGKQQNEPDMKKIESTIQEAALLWMEWEGIVGVAQGETDKGKPCILVLTTSDTAAALQNLPKKFKGFPVKTLPAGNIEAH
jgi:hypothetical protein